MSEPKWATAIPFAVAIGIGAFGGWFFTDYTKVPGPPEEIQKVLTKLDRNDGGLNSVSVSYYPGGRVTIGYWLPGKKSYQRGEFTMGSGRSITEALEALKEDLKEKGAVNAAEAKAIIEAINTISSK